MPEEKQTAMRPKDKFELLLQQAPAIFYPEPIQTGAELWQLLKISLIAITLLCTFFITSANSTAFVLGMLTTGGCLSPSNKKKIFRGLVQSALAIIIKGTSRVKSVLVPLRLSTLTQKNIRSGSDYPFTSFWRIIGKARSMNNITGYGVETVIEHSSLRCFQRIKRIAPF